MWQKKTNKILNDVIHAWYNLSIVHEADETKETTETTETADNNKDGWKHATIIPTINDEIAC